MTFIVKKCLRHSAKNMLCSTEERNSSFLNNMRVSKCNLQPQRWNKTIQTKWSRAERATLGEAKSWEEVDPHTSVWVSVPNAQCTHTHTLQGVITWGSGLLITSNLRKLRTNCTCTVAKTQALPNAKWPMTIYKQVNVDLNSRAWTVVSGNPN